MRRLYTLVFSAALPLILLRLLWRSIKAPDYRRRWRERFGYAPLAHHVPLAHGQQRLWLHTASVGETIAAKPLVDALLHTYPQHQIVVTTMTPTGSAQVQALFAQAIQAQRLLHSYIPYDLPGCIERFLQWSQPTMALFMETELWPNIIHCCQQKKIATLLINGRLSARSLKGYQRIQGLAQPMFSQLTAVAAQTPADAERIAQLRDGPISITGNLKAEIRLSDALQQQAAALKQQWSLGGGRKILIAASTHHGEDEVILQAYQQLRQSIPQLLLIVVPRHPERFKSVYQLCQNSGLSTVLKSQQPPGEDSHIMVADTMGELLLLFGASDLAIMGGTLVDRGGHNFLEPAAWSLPIVSGSSDYNFATIARDLSRAGALTQIDSAQLGSSTQVDLAKALAKACEALLSDSAQHQQQGRAAKAYIDQHRGALERLLTLIDQQADKP